MDNGQVLVNSGNSLLLHLAYIIIMTEQGERLKKQITEPQILYNPILELPL